MYPFFIRLFTGVVLGAFSLRFPHRLFALLFRRIRTVAEHLLRPVPLAIRCFLLASSMVNAANATTLPTAATAAAAFSSAPAATAYMNGVMTTRRNSSDGSGLGAEREGQGSFQLPLHRRDTGIAVAKNVEQGGPVWVTPVTVGNQEFSVVIDTGSADFWVTGVELPESQQGSHRLYDSTRSPTSTKLVKEWFQVNYSFLGASGYVVRERVTVGNITHDLMPVGVATNIGPYLVDMPFGGILGLAFKAENSVRPDQSATFMELVQQTLDLPVFTINFFPGERHNQQKKHVGTCEFGRIDHSLYSGELVSVPVNNRTDGSWTIEFVEMTVRRVRVIQSFLVGLFSSKLSCSAIPNPSQTK
ncbi:hypothetical protein MMC22_004997 [Lobaria immixta]|nr:hypothetical protein [Lobaria immixta]